MSFNRCILFNNAGMARAVVCLGACAMLLALLACANYLAGAILLWSLGERVACVDFDTMVRAWRAAGDPDSIARIRGSVALALIACIWVPLGVPLALRRRARAASARRTE